ncbi:hypothetical protein [Pelomonas sp. Root1237]|uniref:hypothetical protein n=1 Tax=Pelomonas sp. Root1237 TaxID=1736434 RepID=UPI000A863AE7|nr:hypothetical protein [Pelomonas sp. Root1237]
MEAITITDEYLTELRERFEKWADFLNMGFGLVAFTFALACLGTKTPVVNAWFSIAVLSFVRYKGSHLFPAEILRLRKLAKVDEKARVLLKGLESEFLSVKTAVTTYPIFLIGYVLLGAIAFSPVLSKVIPGLGTYVGI